MSKIEHEILAEHETKLLEKEGSGVSWLLNNDRKEDLARLFRLFTRIPNGVDPIAKAFKDHVMERGLELVEMATQSINEEGTVSGKQQALPSTVEQSFVQDIIKCHDKYIAFVSECFNDDVVFQRAFKDAFERFCNKSIGEVTIAELLANFCHSVLKKGGKEKLTDEVIEDHLEKIVKLLAYISDKDLFAEIAKQKLATAFVARSIGERRFGKISLIETETMQRRAVHDEDGIYGERYTNGERKQPEIRGVVERKKARRTTSRCRKRT